MIFQHTPVVYIQKGYGTSALGRASHLDSSIASLRLGLAHLDVRFGLIRASTAPPRPGGVAKRFLSASRVHHNGIRPPWSGRFRNRPDGTDGTEPYGEDGGGGSVLSDMGRGALALGGGQAGARAGNRRRTGSEDGSSAKSSCFGCFSPELLLQKVDSQSFVVFFEESDAPARSGL